MEAILQGVYNGEQGLLSLRQGEPFHILHVLERQGDTVFIVRDSQVLSGGEEEGGQDDTCYYDDDCDMSVLLMLVVTVMVSREMKGRCPKRTWGK